MFNKLAEKRRSIKEYTDRPVEQEKIDEIIETALRSPSGRAARPWHFIVVTDQAMREKLSAARPVGGAFVKDAAVATTEHSYNRANQPQPQLGLYVPRLEELLVVGWERLRKSRLTARRLFDFDTLLRSRHVPCNPPKPDCCIVQMPKNR